MTGESFVTYLRVNHKDLPISESRHFGEIREQVTKICLYLKVDTFVGYESKSHSFA
jgi:hypothetical protein